MELTNELIKLIAEELECGMNVYVVKLQMEKEMKLRKISNIEETNKFLRESFIADYNCRFCIGSA